ncbi:hypothetical protein N7481_008589 [Penicillium waksmanii]|uniref:uncharacterized protein n=1 Tax=Penicillium waksmanii TaxID=69791 RepID=UPI002549B464|nr:uncharacterized protein N7481_008589 [Penicillium waksmanii]KAJ5974882.1 hypothetical protein N7481_008589 [Penicillium waksmanii]
MYHETNHANRMPHFVRDIDQPGDFVAADNFMHPAPQLGDGQLRDYRSLPPEAPTPEILAAIPGYSDGIEGFPERAYLSESPSTIAYRATTTENTPFSPSFYDQGK